MQYVTLLTYYLRQNAKKQMNNVFCQTALSAI